MVYLASPLGFSESARLAVLPQFVERLEAVGCQVHEPFSANKQNGLGPQSGAPDWAFDIAVADSEAVRNCDCIFANINGVPPDEGTSLMMILS